MALETANFLDDLIPTNPVSADGTAQGDDHLRLIKATLKATFPTLASARYLEQPRVDVANAAVPLLWAATSNYANLLGTTAKTGFASGTEGQWKIVRIAATMTLEHDGTTLDLPGDDDIAAVEGDHMIVMCRGGTSNKVFAYFRANGKAVEETFVLPVADDVGKYLQASGVGTTAYTQVEQAGKIAFWPFAAVPTGWLECNGQEVLRTTPLGVLLAGTYGNGNGTTTYNVPDLRGEFIRCWDHGAGRDPNAATRTTRGDLAATTGDNVGTRQAWALEAHTHGYTVPLAAGDGGNQTMRLSSAPAGNYSNNTSGASATTSTETRPRNVYLMPIIKT